MFMLEKLLCIKIAMVHSLICNTCTFKKYLTFIYKLVFIVDEYNMAIAQKILASFSNIIQLCYIPRIAILTGIDAC